MFTQSSTILINHARSKKKKKSVIYLSSHTTHALAGIFGREYNHKLLRKLTITPLLPYMYEGVSKSFEPQAFSPFR